MDGLLNINKSGGITSHDVVDEARRILKQRRIGHTGTLDPMATGVLVLCVGKATRIARYIEAGEKEYKATMRLGIVTDTQDSSGKVVETRRYRPPKRDEVEETLAGFIGEIMQQPPVFSAIKVSGVPSYRLAREGRSSPLRPRKVSIFGIKLLSYDDPYIVIWVRCSKGVYIRTLCHDIGEALGTGGHLTELTRTRSGMFLLEHAIGLEHLRSIAREDRLASVMVSMDEALSHLPVMKLGPEQDKRLRSGGRVDIDAPEMDGGMVRIHDISGRLTALAHVKDGALLPETVFLQPGE